MSPLAARGLVILAALIWSTGGVAIKLASLEAAQIASGRSLVAALALWLLLPRARRRPNRAILWTALANAATGVLFVFANTLTTAGNAIFIQNTAPIWVMLLAPWWLGERATAAERWSAPLAIAGVALFFVEDVDGGRALGNLAAVGASLGYAALILQYRKLDADEGLAATVYGNLIVVVLLGGSWIGAAPTASDLGALVYLGALQQAVAAVVFIAAIRHVRAVEGALLLLFEPLFSPVWAFLLVGERLGQLALAGAGLVVLATVSRTVLGARAAGAGFRGSEGA